MRHCPQATHLGRARTARARPWTASGSDLLRRGAGGSAWVSAAGLRVAHLSLKAAYGTPVRPDELPSCVARARTREAAATLAASLRLGRPGGCEPSTRHSPLGRPPSLNPSRRYQTSWLSSPGRGG